MKVLVIDMQDTLINVMSDQNLVQNSIQFLQIANILELDIIATEQYPKGLGHTNEQLKSLIGQKIFSKTEFSAFDTVLSEIKDDKNIIIVGIEAHICVYQTALDLLKKGYNITLIDECISSRNPNHKKLAFKYLQRQGAKIACGEMVAFDILKVATGDKFKAISKLIK